MLIASFNTLGRYTLSYEYCTLHRMPFYQGLYLISQGNTGLPSELNSRPFFLNLLISSEGLILREGRAPRAKLISLVCIGVCFVCIIIVISNFECQLCDVRLRGHLH